MSHNGAQIQTVPVEVTNAEALAGMINRRHPRRHVRAVYRTFNLAAATPLPILAEDLSRYDTWLVAYGNSVVICESQAQAQDPDNQLGGAGSFVNSPANPQGTLLYVPAQIAGSQAGSYTGEGTAATPGAGTAVATANGGTALPAGTYTLTGTDMLAGTGAAADINNFGLYVGATLIATLPNADTTEQLFAMPALTFVVPAGGAVVAIKTIGAGSGTANYWSSFAATPAAVGGSAPVSQSVRWTLDTTEVAWAVSMAPALLAMTTHNRAHGY
jgi:hypothetical protein